MQIKSNYFRFWLEIVIFYNQNLRRAMSAALDTVLRAFKTRGYSPTSLISKPDFLNLLTALKGQQFDIDIAQQLWQQTAIVQQRYAEVEDICSVVCHAQGILMDRIADIKGQIARLKSRSEELPEQAEQKKISNRLQDKKRDLKQFAEDLEMLTLPFGMDVPVVSGVEQSRGRNSHVLEYTPGSLLLQNPAYNAQLGCMLWLSVSLLILQLLAMNHKFNFLNLLTALVVLSIFMLRYFDTTYLKFSYILTSVSVVFDFLWLFTSAGDYWSPPAKGVHSQNQSAMLKFVVFLTLAGILGKAVLVYLLFGFRDVQPDTRYVLHAYDNIKIQLTANQTDNLISKGIARSI